MSNNNGVFDEVFEYTGKGCAVPKDVTSVRFHPSVVVVEYAAFRDCSHLREVVLMRVSRRLGSLHFIAHLLVAHH